MARAYHFPDADRLSVVTSTILAAYVSSSFVDLPGYAWSARLPGAVFEISLTYHTLIALVVAGLTASGMDWLLRDHPALGERRTFQHLLLPALTAWIIEVPLINLSPGPLWWAAFTVGGLLLVCVLIAEYIAVDAHDRRQPVAALGLTAISFALYLVLAVSLRTAGVRLYLLLPALTLSAGLVTLRTLHLRLHGRWEFAASVTAALIVGQLAAALHYWPISPAAFGLTLLGAAYALTSLLGNLAEGKKSPQAVIEPGLVLIFLVGCALWLG